MSPKQIIAEIMDRIPCVERPGHNMLAHEIVKKLGAGGYAIVPVSLTDAMRERMAWIEDGPHRAHDDVWSEMLDAALVQDSTQPAQGKRNDR